MNLKKKVKLEAGKKAPKLIERGSRRFKSVDPQKKASNSFKLTSTLAEKTQIKISKYSKLSFFTSDVNMCYINLPQGLKI